MKFRPLAIADVVLIEPDVHADERGFFMESWHSERYAAAGIAPAFVQVNHSRSAQHVLRGLHYQIECAQGKLIRVVAGEVFDVAVDLRRGSPSFGRWVGERLSAANRRQLWVPPGFAHGFLALSDGTELIYMCTDHYAPQHERTLRWDDAEVGIDWPLAPGCVPLLSAKDAGGRSLAEADSFP